MKPVVRLSTNKTVKMSCTGHNCQNMPSAKIRWSDFSLAALPDLLRLKFYYVSSQMNPMVKLQSLCKKLKSAYAVATLSRRTSCFSTRLGFGGHCQLQPERLQTHFWSTCKSASQSRLCYPHTNMTRTVN